MNHINFASRNLLALIICWGFLGGAPQAQAQPAAGDTGLKMTAASGAQDAEPAPIRVSMEFQDANLKDVLKVFSQQTGINVIASKEVGDRTITLYLEDVTVLDALDQILQAAQLTYERPAGSQIYIVKPQPPPAPPAPVEEHPPVPLVTKVYRLKFARVSTSRLAVAADALIAQAPFEAQQLTTTAAGGAGGGSGGGGAPPGGGGAAGGGAAVAIGIDKIIAKLLTDAGTVVVDERTNSLVVTDVADNFSRIEAVLNTLDVKTAQILIEAELLETTLSKLKDLGVKWGSGDSGTIFQFTPAKAGTKLPFSNFFGTQVGGEGLKNSTADPTLTLGSVDTSKAIAVLNALETDTDTKILARPRVLTLDNESAVIRLTSQQAIGFQTTTGEQTATTTATPERATTGVILAVTPQVNQDGFITMLVEPSVTKVVTSQIQPPSSVGGTVVDPKSRSARAMVRIRQGETLVLGGLIDRSESESLRKVPILSDVPIVGGAFKNKAITNAASELIVFVTPRILSEPGGTQAGAQARALAQAGSPLLVSREQERESASPRQELIEQTLLRLEHLSL